MRRLALIATYIAGCVYAPLAFIDPVESSPGSGVVMIAEFRAYQSEPQAEIQAQILTQLKQSFADADFTVLVTQRADLQGQLADARAAGAQFLITGAYRPARGTSPENRTPASTRQQIANLQLFGEIYNPETGYLIDAHSLTDLFEQGLLDSADVDTIQLDPTEIREADDVRIKKFADRLARNVRANPQARERRENVDEYTQGTRYGREQTFATDSRDSTSASEEVFRSFDEDIDTISVGSNVVTDFARQPVSISIITRRQIRVSGARTLNELLNTFVPGYFMVEDQDDVIGAFRGFAPDSNSKILLLLNGHNINTEWFWGPPDALLQGMDLQYIERVEVIRGPGSVTLGQGALLGVVNVITKNGATFEGTAITAGAGQDKYSRATIQSGRNGDLVPELKTYFYLSRLFYNGQRLRSEGWARDKLYETREGHFEFDRGLYRETETNATGDYGDNTVALFPSRPGKTLTLSKNVASSGSRLKKSENVLGTGVIEYKTLEFTGFYTDQQRDNYNFMRDRNEIQNVIKSGSLNYRYDFGSRVSLTTKTDFTEDDVILHSHSGRIMGGTREQRYGGALILNIEDLPKNNNLAVGAEFRRYDMGLTDRNGNNNIINNADESLFDNNTVERTYVFGDSIRVGSFFVEDFYSVTPAWDLFAAFRYDRHEFWGYNISPRVGTIIRPPIKDLRLRFSYQQGFRGASGVEFAGGFRRDGLLRSENFDQVAAAGIATTDRFGNPTTYGNIPEAKPETLDSYEAAVNYRINRNWSLDQVFFYNISKNIVDVGVIYSDTQILPPLGTDLPGDWNGYFYFRNLPGEIRNGGAELALNYENDWLTGGLSHSLVRVLSASRTLYNEFQGGMYVTNDPDNQRARAYPENVTRLNLIFHFIQSLDVSVNWLYYAAWYSPLGRREIGQHVLNAGLAYQATENLSVTLEGKNLLRSGRLWPMNSNAGGPDSSNGAPALEEATYWATVTYTF